MLRALAARSGETVANAAAGEGADREADRRGSSPAADRAESAARGLLAEGERFPTWREVAKRAEVGRSTAAEALRSLRVEYRTTSERPADEPLANQSQVDEREVDDDPIDSRQPETAPARPSVQPEPPAAGEPSEPPPSPSPVPEPERAAVSQARDAVARAAVVRAAQRTRELEHGPDDAADRTRAQQLPLWTAADLDTAAARDPTPHTDADASSRGAPVGSDAHAD